MSSTNLFALSLSTPPAGFEQFSPGLHAYHFLHPLWALPFVLMLLAIAFLPVLYHEWWEKHLFKLFISLILSVPILVYFSGFFPGGLELIRHTGFEFFSFLAILLALFVVGAGIHIGGNLRGTPRANTLILLFSSVLASFMGTTGASMLFIRPLLKANEKRRRVTHTVVFFVFLTGNIGGLLTPLGDPPLFMGYLAGVPFTWTFNLWPQWLLALTVLLTIYYLIDRAAYRTEELSKLQPETASASIYIKGWFNVMLMLGVVITVAFVTVAPLREFILIGLALISLLFSDGAVRRHNNFSWEPIIEVTILFGGIFTTMIPALYLLKLHSQELGLALAHHFYWLTGILSAFLDNTPTYMVFFNIAQNLEMHGEVAGVPPHILAAISLGAVFFGAMTYIGNAPNFMIKAIAEKHGVIMPSFFGYMRYSVIILLPLFLLIDLLWLR